MEFILASQPPLILAFLARLPLAQDVQDAFLRILNVLSIDAQVLIASWLLLAKLVSIAQKKIALQAW